LTILNERKFSNGAKVMSVPLLSMFGASNEVPNDESLAAIFDRFLLRVVSDNLDSYHFHNLVAKGVANEAARITGKAEQIRPLFSSKDLHELHKRFEKHLQFSEDFLSKYKGLVFQIRSEGVSLSDRRVVKLLKLFAASAILDGREQTNDADFFILKHIWNNLDQVEILEEIVGPVVDRWYREHPTERRFSGGQVGLDELLAELGLIRELLTSGEPLSDIQLFSQLKNLNEIKAALQAIDSDTARRMVGEVDQLLESVFASSKFG
jgi:MoxR-like ATPase